MIHAAFSHVREWVFDLDNTLYDPAVRLFDQIETRMVAFVMAELGVDASEANRLRATYWKSHGTTLAGLMDVHGMAPERFLKEVHEIDFSVLSPAPRLASLISNLPGRKIVYTNGTAPYAGNVLNARGLGSVFDAVYGVEHAGFRPKPEAQAFEQVFALAGLRPELGAMFEDEPRNLEVPHQLGMQTVHVAPSRNPAAYIQHHTDDLEGFLSQVSGGPSLSQV